MKTRDPLKDKTRLYRLHDIDGNPLDVQPYDFDGAPFTSLSDARKKAKKLIKEFQEDDLDDVVIWEDRPHSVVRRKNSRRKK